ncbi:MAG: hypothetical protein C0594_05265 [Marinilabiliales bacterium]|nr:MAG: hypothetical protein C0594_05265 [Marinilabiliales bacterium]
MEREIDLIIVTNKLLKFIRKYWIVLLIASFSGAVIGYFSFMENTAYYQSKMLVSSGKSNPQTAVYIVNSIQNYIDGKHFEELSQKTGTEIEKLKQLKSITAKAEEYDPKMEHEVGFYKIDIEVYNPDALNWLPEMLKEFLNSNPLISAQKNKSEELNNAMIQKLNEEISQLDSFQIKSYDCKTNRDAIILSGFGKEIMELYTMKSDLELEAISTLYFDPVQGFLPANSSIYLSKSKTLIIYSFLGFAIAFIIGLLIELIIYARKLD